MFKLFSEGSFLKNIFIGLIFALFSVKISLGLGNIDLLPNPIGFYLILKGFKEIHPVNASIFDVFGYLKIAVIYSVFTFAFRLLGIFAMMGIFSVVFELIEVGLLTFIVYKLIDDFRKTETEKEIDLNTRKLEQLWNINICITVISLLSAIIPNFPLIAVVLALVSFVAAAAFIYEFYKTKTAYPGAEV